MRMLTIVGARPQFIKAATVSRTIQDYNPNHNPLFIEEKIVHTGQHYDSNMSDVFFQEMQIPPPTYHLGIGGKSQGAMTGQMLEKLEEVFLQEKPDLVLVYGDTNSTLAGALAAVKLHIPVAHVEAGLRSFNLKMPEEVNRLLTDQVSSLLFCPTETAVKNLENEGFKNRDKVSIFQVGDVMYDAALFYKKIASPSPDITSLIKNFSKGFYLATIHRAENTDEPLHLNDIMTALDRISQKIPVVLPLHPRTAKMVEKRSFPNVQFIEPVGYFDMITLLTHCQGVFTDSGGLQKEAYFFQKKCITLREETEWVELVTGGFNTLTGANLEKILEAEQNLQKTPLNYSQDLYGNGKASQKILEILANI